MTVYVNYFGAPWCSPCKTLKPAVVKTINNLKAKHPELNIVFQDIDVDEYPHLAREYDIQTVPVIVTGLRPGVVGIESRLQGGMATAKNLRASIERMCEL